MANITRGSIHTGDSVLTYQDTGAGPAVVLLHADVADSGMWDGVWEALATDYRVIRYDRAGFGSSAPVKSVESHQLELARLLDHLGIEAAHLVGCSRGGEIALNFALAFPERVRSVVAVSATPGGFAMQGTPPDEVLAMMGAYQNGDLGQTADWITQIFLAGPSRSLDAIDARLRQRVRDTSLKLLANHVWEVTERAPLAPAAADRLDAIRAPVLALAGALDNAELARAASVIAKGVAEGRHEVVAGAAHLLPMEQPSAFAERVRAFISTTL